MRKATVLFISAYAVLFMLSCGRKEGGPAAEQPSAGAAPSAQAVKQDPMLNEPIAKELLPEKLRDKTTMTCKKCGWHMKADAASCPKCKNSGDFKRERDFYPEFFRPWKWCLLLNSDEIWATGWGGVSIYSLKEMKEIKRVTEDDGVHSDFLGFAAMCRDDDKNIWVSGGGIPESEIFGLSKWDGQKWVAHTADVGLTSRNIGTYTVVYTWNSTWAGGPKGGLVRIRPLWKKGAEGDPWRRYWSGNFDLIPCDNVMDIAVDREDGTVLWLAMYDQPEGKRFGEWRRPGEGIPPWDKGDKIDPPGGLAKWGCRWGREIGFWTAGNSECPTGRALAVAEDGKGQMWFGGDEPSKGIGCLDKKTGKWSIYNEANGCPIKTAWNIVVDKNDNVWFTHARDPIYRFDGKTWTPFVPEFPGKGKAGIPGGDSLLVLDNGNVIVSTEFGLLLYDAASKSWKPFQDLPYPYETSASAAGGAGAAGK